MEAIRKSPDPLRTMDAFWKGQLNSKEWLITNLTPYINKFVRVDIYGGWVGVLASMMFQSGLPIKSIRSIDIDPSCKTISEMMNKSEEINGKYTAVTADMCDIDSDADVVINTSCEHINQSQYDTWINKISSESLIVLQSNNYEIEEHVRVAKSLEEFKEQSNLNNILWTGKLELPLYTRYMIIGKR
jgi:hypothetical protein